jgi:hypothetical protein
VKKWKVLVSGVDIGVVIAANTREYAYGQATSSVSKSITLEEIKPEGKEEPNDREA